MRRGTWKSVAVCASVCACLAGVAAGFAVGAAAAGEPSAGSLAVLAGDGHSGAPTPGPATASELESPGDVAADAAGDIYIADETALVVEKVTVAGTLSVIAGDGQPGPPTPGPATSSALGEPSAVAVDAQGNVYIADSADDVVEKVTPAGTLSIVAGRVGQAQEAPTPGPATSSELEPFAVAIDGSGNLYVADDYETATATHAYILKVTPSGTLSVFAGTGLIGSPTPGPATSSELNFPDGLAVDGTGNLYIADAYANVIARVTPTGTLSIVAGSGAMGAPVPGPATSSPLDNPAGIAVDGNGSLYIANPESNDVLAVGPSGTLSVLAGTGAAGPPTAGPAADSELDFPTGVAADGFADVYVADTENSEVEEVFSGTGPARGDGGATGGGGTTGGGTGTTTGGTGGTTTGAGTGSPATAGVTPVPGGLATHAVVPLPLRCAGGAVTLVSVLLHGGSVELAGLARASYAGDTVQVKVSGVPGRLAARDGGSAKIAADGSFHLRLPAPTGAGTAGARYTATVAGHSSLALKLHRLLEVVAEQRAGGGERVTLQTTQPVGGGRTLRITRELSCTKTTTYKLLKLPASGRATISLPAPAGPGGVAYYRAVLPFSRGTTYSLPIEVGAGG